MTHALPVNGNPHDGTAIYVRDTIATTIIILNTALQAIAIIHVYFGQQLYMVCSIYSTSHLV